jgi:hypothetical protein
MCPCRQDDSTGPTHVCKVLQIDNTRRKLTESVQKSRKISILSTNTAGFLSTPSSVSIGCSYTAPWWCAADATAYVGGFEGSFDLREFGMAEAH